MYNIIKQYLFKGHIIEFLTRSIYIIFNFSPAFLSVIPTFLMGYYLGTEDIIIHLSLFFLLIVAIFRDKSYNFLFFLVPISIVSTNLGGYCAHNTDLVQSYPCEVIHSLLEPEVIEVENTNPYSE